MILLGGAPAIPRHSRHGSREPLFHAPQASAPAKAVAAGFEGKCNPGDRAAGPDRLIPPALQQGKQPFWAWFDLLARLTLNPGKHTAYKPAVLLCRQLDLFGRELLAVDGTRIKAVNNKNRNFTRATLTQFIKAADAKLDDYLQRLDKRDANESGTAALGSRTWPRRSPRSGNGASGTRICWRPWTRRERARFR